MVSMVESGRQRLDIGLVPKLASTLGMDAQKLTMLALREYEPSVYRVLFGDDPPVAGGVYIDDVHERLDVLPRQLRGALGVIIEALSRP